MSLKIPHVLLGTFCLAVCFLSYFTLVNYPGRAFIYIIFTIVLNVLLALGFTKNKMFFDTFIGIFFWLGYWMKFSLRVAFIGGEFHEPIGQFNGTGAAFDHTLLVTSCGISALLIASLIRRRFFSPYTSDVVGQPRFEGIFEFYQTHRVLILTLFASLFVFIAVTNIMLGMYQRGSVPSTILPFGLSRVYAWLLLFGLTSVSAVILDCEFRMRRNPYLVSILSLLECFSSSASMLSRGMILNGGALILGVDGNAKRRSVHPNVPYKLIMLMVFAVLFVLSVFTVNQIRKDLYYFLSSSQGAASMSFRSGSFQSNSFLSDAFLRQSFLSKPVVDTMMGIRGLFVDRWVGMEGIMAVSSYQGLGWDLWRKAWQERYSHYGTSMYDLTLIKSQYLDVDLSKHHYIGLPGILAFFYYPGSFLFLFFSMFFLGFLAAGIELSIYKLSGANVILCALFGQVLASRYAHFGYVPYQSYLLFGSIYLNVLIILFFNKFLCYWNRNKDSRSRREKKSIG